MGKQAFFKGQPFWSGSVNLADGRIEEIHSYQEAQRADFHHSIYFSSEQAERIRDAECGFFWIDSNGSVQAEWREKISDTIITKIEEQITVQEDNKQNDTHMERAESGAEQAMENLELNRRSLNFSEVEIYTDYCYACFLVPGICDRDVLEESDTYQGLMADADETQVIVRINAYSVGRGESESPDDDELKLIIHYREEIDERYGIDHILLDVIRFEFEPEEEY